MIRRAIAAACAPAWLGCASGSDGTAPVASLPASYAECVASGGELERPTDGARCFRYYSPGSDRSAYLACRDAGGVQGVVGRGMAREVVGQSHVCTLVFERPGSETGTHPETE